MRRPIRGRGRARLGRISAVPETPTADVKIEPQQDTSESGPVGERNND